MLVVIAATTAITKYSTVNAALQQFAPDHAYA